MIDGFKLFGNKYTASAGIKLNRTFDLLEFEKPAFPLPAILEILSLMQGQEPSNAAPYSYEPSWN